MEVEAKWDKLIDLGLRRVAYGATSAGLIGLLLCRGSHARVASVAFGAGAGIGSAWTQVSTEFEELVPGILKK